jgi:alkyl hydroperoxide reductase subunit AhpC
VRNEWRYTPVLPIGLHGLQKEKNTFYVLCHDVIQCSVDDAFHAWLKEEENEASCYYEQFDRAYT